MLTENLKEVNAALIKIYLCNDAMQAHRLPFVDHLIITVTKNTAAMQSSQTSCPPSHLTP
jgi:hypothetical protein